MSDRLPPPMSFDELRIFRAESERWLGIAREIARSHGIDGSSPEVFRNGSNLITGFGGAILKLYPPMLRHQFVAERASLKALAGKLSVPIPAILAEGERDGWPYLAISRLRGVTGELAWPTLGEADKVRILGQIGRLIAEVQRVPAGELLELEPKWKEFIPKQISGCRARHERQGFPARYLVSLEDYLRDAPAIVPTEIRPVILTGEYIPENFLLEKGPEGWSLAGLIDFGDVMTGFGEYDLLGPFTFMCGGDRARTRALLLGYGFTESELDGALSRRLMTLYLLHRFSDPDAQIRIDRWRERASTLRDLERLVFPLA